MYIPYPTTWKNMNKPILWTKDFIVVWLTTFFVALNFYLLMTTIAAYAIEHFNASQRLAGLAAGMFVIGALVSRLLAGKYMEVIGRKKLLYGSLALLLFASLFYFFVGSIISLIVVRFIHGTAFGVSMTVMSTAVIDIISVERRGEGISYFSLSSTMAIAVGPFLGFLILQHADFNLILIVCTLFSLLSIIMMFFSHIPESKIAQKEIEAMKGFSMHDIFEKSAIPVSIIMLIMGIAYSGIVSFINVYAIKINLTTSASFFFVAYAVFTLITRPLTGRLQDIKGDNIVMYPALLLFALSLAVLSQAGHGFILLLAGALVGLGFGTCMSCTQTIVIKGSPLHRIGLATSTFFFCLDAGMGTGPYLAGNIIPIAGFRGMYMTLAVVVFLSIFLYYFVHGRKTG
jgi:MFS family permease